MNARKHSSRAGHVIVRFSNKVQLINFGTDAKAKEYINSNDSLGRFTIQHVIMMPDSIFQVHMHSCEHVGYILRGNCKIWIWKKNGGKKIHKLSDGDLFLIPKFTPHSIVVGKYGCEKLVFNIPGVDLNDPKRIIGINKGVLTKTWTQKKE